MGEGRRGVSIHLKLVVVSSHPEILAVLKGAAKPPCRTDSKIILGGDPSVGLLYLVHVLYVFVLIKQRNMPMSAQNFYDVIRLRWILLVWLANGF